MNHPNIDEEIPVRGFTDFNDLKEDTGFTKDEEQQGALRQIHKLLKEEVDGLDQWHAFDIKENVSAFKIKQQIEVHRMVADILQPILEAVEQALAAVDDNFRRRNQK